MIQSEDLLTADDISIYKVRLNMVKHRLCMMVIAILVLWMLPTCTSSLTENKSSSKKEIKSLLKNIVPQGLEIASCYFGDINRSPNSTLEQRSINGNLYNEVKLDNVSNINELKELTESVYTRSFSEKAFYPMAFNTDIPKFIEIDGRLFAGDIGSVSEIPVWDIDSF